MKPKYIFPAKVLRVIDGDTLEVAIDHGFNIHNHVMLRLQAVHAPELDAADDSDRLKALESKLVLEKLLPPDTPVTVETFRVREGFGNQKQTFNRYVAVIYDTDGNNINKTLIGYLKGEPNEYDPLMDTIRDIVGADELWPKG